MENPKSFLTSEAKIKTPHILLYITILLNQIKIVRLTIDDISLYKVWLNGFSFF